VHAAEAEAALRAGGAPLVLDLAERVARGQGFFDAEMKDEAAAELDAALKLVAAVKTPDAATAALACTARFLYGRTLHKQKKFGAAAVALAAAADGCTDPAMLEKALYHAANVSLAAGLPKKALYYATRLETELPASPLADDAALFAARATGALGDAKKSTELLASIGVRYPDGDVAEDALWSLAWDAYRAGDFDGAEGWLDRAIATIPWVPTYYGAGRSLYWKARLRARAKDDDAARALWARCLREYPLSYYATLSYARLAETDAAAAGAAWRDALTPVVLPPDKPERPPPGGAGAGWTFPPDALPAAPAFERGVELLRIGLADEARKEFGTLPAGDDAARWLLAVLYDRAGAWTLSHNLPRRFLKGWDRHWPVGGWKKHWLIAYPRGFRAEIEPAATAAGVPPALLFALVREESAFDPAVQSWADAVGLTQLLVSTARATAKKMAAFKTATITLDTLKDPALNVPIGARFLGDLLARWRHPLLAIGGYNAGGGAVAKWVGERGAMPLDEYVESIPYDQTRGYTKRVFASYGVYTFLYEGTPLVVSLGTAAAAAGKSGK
jgi:soluble lytic murein transglycosylase